MAAPDQAEKPAIYRHADQDGNFRRKDSVFRDFVSKDPSSRFPAEKDRYALYVNYGCPWAHRTVIVRALKGLEDIVQLILTDVELTKDGWLFTGKNGSPEAEPLYGFTKLRELYEKADPGYQGRYTVPTLWDKKQHTIVNNESSEIIRMLYSEASRFDDLLPESKREINRPGGGFYPSALRADIDAMNEWVYNTVNNGVYKTGFATTQEAYEANLFPLFASLDRLEEHLSQPVHQPYLFGEHITEADIRLYTTLIRFDVAYVNIFLCNLKMIRHDYPRLSKWLRTLYWDDSERTNGGVFKKTTYFDIYKYGYLRAKGHGEQHLIVPKGPQPDIYPLDHPLDKLVTSTISVLPAENGTVEHEQRQKMLRLPTEYVKPTSAHRDENVKWEAEIAQLPPAPHLALS